MVLHIFTKAGSYNNGYPSSVVSVDFYITINKKYFTRKITEYIGTYAHKHAYTFKRIHTLYADVCVQTYTSN